MEQLVVTDMKDRFAKEIINWQYESPYDLYNLKEDALTELLEGSYYCIIDKSTEELVGFYCIGKSAQVPTASSLETYEEGYEDIGIGMKPELTGKGNGKLFFSFILDQLRQCTQSPLRLTVAQFNQRAIHLYEKFGFVKKKAFTNNSTTFVTMIKE